MTEESRKILALPMLENDASVATVGDYLRALLLGVWQDRECFNGKRPFGNSGWEYEIYATLGRNGLIKVIFDKDGFVDSIPSEEMRKADKLIDQVIGEMGKA